MSAAIPCTIRSFMGVAIVGVMALAMTIGMAVAQVLQAAAPTRSGVSQPPTPTLVSMAQAARTQDYTSEQLRRFRDDVGNVVAVRERVVVDANGSAHPDFALTFLGVEGELAGSPRTLEWQRVYSRFGPLFFTHGMFRVREHTAAAANYTLHDFGSVLRAGRAARRMVVFPGTFDKAIWVVDVDTQTNVPLYFAEFDVQMHVLAEVEVQTFTPAVGPLPQPSTSSVVTQLPDYAAAQSFLGNPGQIVDPMVAVASEYQLDAVQVQVDPLTGRPKLTMTYTDGIDQFVVVQAPGTPDLFGSLPGKLSGGHVIARFRDPAMSVLLFWEGGVSFHVAGRGSLQRLDDLARNVYVQALSSN
jgi:hypothetical protein